MIIHVNSNIDKYQSNEKSESEFVNHFEFKAYSAEMRYSGVVLIKERISLVAYLLRVVIN